ncbi:tRNA pseudouridine(38-40) synthase TruA [Aurantibacter crassamenti]|uniref:tRNA pseudouridine synthase A n=1 Tax=Aurantibacter crassamenti TaxID=1837375 RepID=UPI00193AA2E0|nr:tRNA pseudouridine(38-40) synthase TruA [Aurantibacter crassamenti]MBM1107082.1 tRNA pseudouridine(38-40) synthase TruA [Aurantibacter crassamenti]
MNKKYSYYLIRIQFLGFRYSGWQKQPNQKTVESMLLKTLKFILPERKLKILGAGRTDAKVSALNAAFELFLEGEPLTDIDAFKTLFNLNLPSDIKIISITDRIKDFNIIKDVKSKEYVYLFSFGDKNHPFAAPFITNVQEQLNLELMQQAAKLFEGLNDFSAFTVKQGKEKDNIRKVTSCYIIENNLLKANFFPDTSFALHIEAEGFVRYQVRMIMGALIQLGKGEIDFATIEESLSQPSNVQFTYVAPGSGLLLNQLDFKDEKN